MVLHQSKQLYILYYVIVGTLPKQYRIYHSLILQDTSVEFRTFLFEFFVPPIKDLITLKNGTENT